MTEDYNPTMLNQDCNRKLFNWFLARVDVLTRLRAQCRSEVVAVRVEIREVPATAQGGGR